MDPLLTPETHGAVFAAVMRLYGCLDRAPPDVLTDRRFIFDAVRQVGLVAFKHSSDVLRGDIELIQLTCDKVARDNTPMDALSEVIRQKRQDAYDAVITYVPTDAPVADYVDGRDRGRAGIEVRYWDLVNTAFDDLLPGAGERFRASTPEPDVPVVDVSRIE